MSAARKSSARITALKKGFRSGLEETLAAEIERVTGAPADYESTTISYLKPERRSKYTPDFKLPSGVIVESKGRFTVQDRQKHLLIKAQHPDKDIRFVFSNPNTKIAKGSDTSYADWCDKHGFLYSKKSIPLDWF